MCKQIPDYIELSLKYGETIIYFSETLCERVVVIAVHKFSKNNRELYNAHNIPNFICYVIGGVTCLQGYGSKKVHKYQEMNFSTWYLERVTIIHWASLSILGELLSLFGYFF